MGVGHNEMDRGKDRRGWGVKGVRGRGESKDFKLLMGKEGRGGMSKHVGRREGGVCGPRLR